MNRKAAEKSTPKTTEMSVGDFTFTVYEGPLDDAYDWEPDAFSEPGEPPEYAGPAEEWDAASRFYEPEQPAGSRFSGSRERELPENAPPPAERRFPAKPRKQSKHLRRIAFAAALLLVPAALVLSFRVIGSLPMEYGDAARVENPGDSGPAADTRYYVMESGTNYHLEGCRVLEGTEALTSYKRKQDAEKDGYTPCACVPPGMDP